MQIKVPTNQTLGTIHEYQYFYLKIQKEGGRKGWRLGIKRMYISIAHIYIHTRICINTSILPVDETDLQPCISQQFNNWNLQANMTTELYHGSIFQDLVYGCKCCELVCVCVCIISDATTQNVFSDLLIHYSILRLWWTLFGSCDDPASCHKVEDLELH